MSTRKHTVCLAAILALCSTVLLAKGKPTTTPAATVTFEDSAGDAIQSDGLGSYDAEIDSGVVVLKTGKKRSIYFDFSTCLPGLFCQSPFGSADTGSVSNVTMTLWLGNGVSFAFNLPGGRFELDMAQLNIAPFDDDNDGTIDRYLVSSDGTQAAWLDKLLSKGLAGAPRRKFFGFFSMPFQFEVVVN